jgi:hypothetical protein
VPFCPRALVFGRVSTPFVAAEIDHEEWICECIDGVKERERHADEHVATVVLCNGGLYVVVSEHICLTWLPEKATLCGVERGQWLIA